MSVAVQGIKNNSCVDWFLSLQRCFIIAKNTELCITATVEADLYQMDCFNYVHFRIIKDHKKSKVIYGGEAGRTLISDNITSRDTVDLPWLKCDPCSKQYAKGQEKAGVLLCPPGTIFFNRPFSTTDETGTNLQTYSQYRKMRYADWDRLSCLLAFRKLNIGFLLDPITRLSSAHCSECIHAVTQ